VSFRRRQWTPAGRAIVIAVVTIAMGSLFVAAYSIALGDPVPHHIDGGVVGSQSSRPQTVRAVQSVVRNKLVFHRFASVQAALDAVDEQAVYAVLDLTSPRPTLYVASAAGASVAHLLERVDGVDSTIRVVDARPVASNDPNGLDIFYLMLVATIIAFMTVFQVRGLAGNLEQRHHVAVVLGIALAGSLVLTFVDGPLLDRPAGAYPEEFGILALHLIAVASFASLMAVLVGRWAVLPTWFFFVILGNASSGGPVSPPLLPEPFAFLSQWLPSGATVTALRNSAYFRGYQHARPLIVLASWAALLFASWVLVARRREGQRRAPDEADGSRLRGRD
jgi:hypothetical protein